MGQEPLKWVVHRDPQNGTTGLDPPPGVLLNRQAKTYFPAELLMAPFDTPNSLVPFQQPARQGNTTHGETVPVSLPDRRTRFCFYGTGNLSESPHAAKIEPTNPVSGTPSQIGPHFSQWIHTRCIKPGSQLSDPKFGPHFRQRT